MGKEVVAGIDLGGTNIVAGLYGNDGLLDEISVPTEVHLGADKVIENMANCILSLKERHSDYSIKGLGIGTPGPLNRKKGIIYTAPNLKWNNLLLKDIMEEKVNLPTIIENDANAAIYGEYAQGIAKGHKIVIGFTLGTGIGGGIIINGEILHGINDAAAELGHVVIDPNGPKCGCGNNGCVEAFSSATGIINFLKNEYKKNKNSLVYKLVNDNLDELSPAIVYEAACKGDKFALFVFDRTAKYLGIMTANVLNIFNPDIVLFVGGITNAGNLLLDKIKHYAKQYAFDITYNSARIEFGKLGNKAGIIGICALTYKYFLNG